MRYQRSILSLHGRVCLLPTIDLAGKKFVQRTELCFVCSDGELHVQEFIHPTNIDTNRRTTQSILDLPVAASVEQLIQLQLRLDERRPDRSDQTSRLFVATKHSSDPRSSWSLQRGKRSASLLAWRKSTRLCLWSSDPQLDRARFCATAARERQVNSAVR